MRGLIQNSVQSVPLAAPNERVNSKHLADEDVKVLNDQDASIYSASVALGNYLSIDMSDIRNGVKEVARRMAKPRNVDYRQIIHFGRYIGGKMRVVNKFCYQKNYKVTDVWSDTDHAG